MMRKIILMQLIFSPALLMASNPNNIDDLSQYINSVKRRTPIVIAPIPEFKSPSQNLITEPNLHKSPFRLLDSSRADGAQQASVRAVGIEIKYRANIRANHWIYLYIKPFKIRFPVVVARKFWTSIMCNKIISERLRKFDSKLSRLI